MMMTALPQPARYVLGEPRLYVSTTREFYVDIFCDEDVTRFVASLACVSRTEDFSHNSALFRVFLDPRYTQTDADLEQTVQWMREQLAAEFKPIPPLSLDEVMADLENDDENAEDTNS